jgi:DNA replicative helicase MCM subunit Mcm2 (Cdc46/Mcm family)
VEAEDVDLAVRIFDAWVTRLGETGKSWDLNIMYGGLPPSVKDQMEKLQKIVREEDRGRGAPKTAVEERARRDFPDITPDRFRYLMDKLYTEGSIFERDDDHWRAA